MDKNEIRNKIILKQKEVDLEQDQNKKNKLRQDLQILNLRLDAQEIKEKVMKLKKT